MGDELRPDLLRRDVPDSARRIDGRRADQVRLCRVPVKGSERRAVLAVLILRTEAAGGSCRCLTLTSKPRRLELGACDVIIHDVTP